MSAIAVFNLWARFVAMPSATAMRQVDPQQPVGHAKCRRQGRHRRSILATPQDDLGECGAAVTCAEDCVLPVTCRCPPDLKAGAGIAANALQIVRSAWAFWPSHIGSASICRHEIQIACSEQ
jgi:hypothetical protein